MASQRGLSRPITRVLSVATGCVFALIGLLLSPTPVLVAWAVMGAVVGVCVTVYEKGNGHHDKARRHGVIAGIAFAAMCLILAGLITTLGAVALLVILPLLAAVGLWIWRHRDIVRTPSQVLEHPSTPPEARQQPSFATDRIDTMTVPELCAAWQRTYWLLTELPPGPRRHSLVAARQRLLDALDNHNPDGIAQWLRTDPRAGSNPLRYVDPHDQELS